YSFFFSSRRRHTRFSRDWSSDVCSSDLGHAAAVVSDGTINITSNVDSQLYTWSKAAMGVMAQSAGGPISVTVNGVIGTMGVDAQIGRASCRERGERPRVGGAS